MRINAKDNFFGLTLSRGQDLVVVGIPWDRTSSYRQGAASGPDYIRRATSSLLYNQSTERGDDLTRLWRICDHGNVRIPKQPAGLFKAIYSTVVRHNHDGSPMLFLGGDHFATYPAFRVVSELRRKQLSLLYFDAHPDLYPKYEGALYSHATVVSRILEDRETSSGTVCYVGIRASTAEQEKRVKALNLTEYTTQDVYAKGCEAISSIVREELSGNPVYVSIDLDCLDPAYAPGVGNPQPGGLTTRQLIDLLHGLDGLEIFGCDVVEYSPPCESKTRTTAFAAAILIKELLGIIRPSK